MPSVVPSGQRLHRTTIIDPEWMFVVDAFVVSLLVHSQDGRLPFESTGAHKNAGSQGPLLLEPKPRQCSICFMIRSMASSGVVTEETSF